MKIEILRSVMISGEPALAGSILEVTASVANLLIGMNKAQAAPEPAVPAPTNQPAPQPEPETPLPVKRSPKRVPTPEADQ